MAQFLIYPIYRERCLRGKRNRLLELTLQLKARLKCLLGRCKQGTSQFLIRLYIHIIGKIHPGLYDSLSVSCGKTVISRANNAAKNDMGS